MSLQLFETVLRKNDSMALDELVLRYLNNRGYHLENPGKEYLFFSISQETYPLATFRLGNIIIQTEPAELEWDLEPGLDAVAADAADSHRTESQSEIESKQGAFFLFLIASLSLVMYARGRDSERSSPWNVNNKYKVT